jgi:hypothetical protein
VKKLHRATLLILASAALAGAASLLLASCDNSYGSLASIQGEAKQSGTDTFKKAPVTKALRFAGRYYATTAKILSRAVSGGAWAVLPVDGSSDYNVLAMANDGDTAIYVSIFDASGANKLYSYNGTAWTALSGIPAASCIDGLYFVNGILFAQAHVDYTSPTPGVDRFSLYYLLGSTLASTDASLQSKEAYFVDIAWDSSVFWFATESALYRGTASATGAVADGTATAGLSGKTIASLLYSAHDSVLYAGTSTGYLYRCSDATSQGLGSEPISALVDLGDGTLLAGLGTTTSVLTGGYWEGAFPNLVDGEGGAVTLDASHYSTTVYDKAALYFYWDLAAETLFACVAPGSSSVGYGLYSSTRSTGTWSGWTAE